MLLRSALAGLLIVLLTAGATATAALLEINEYVPPPDPGPPVIDRRDEVIAKPGKAQTLLLLGSDRRWIDKQNGDPARSDTMMLVRMDPDEEATTVLSIPRDLRTQIPGYGYEKINDAYALGGPALTVKTIRELTGLDIHHVVNVNFGGFSEAVDELGCFYIDVDRKYFHSNEGVPIGQRYAEIDVPAGYQKLCGQDSLDYVRFRHADNDLVRAARQQDYLRSAKDQLSTSSLIKDRDRLSEIFGDYTQTDRNLSTLNGFLRLLKLGLYSADKPVRQMEFPATFTQDFSGDLPIDYVEASQADIDAVVEDFMNGGGEQARPDPPSSSGTKRRSRPKTLRGLVAAGGMVDARQLGRGLVKRAKGKRRLGIPLRFPAYLTPDGRYAEQENPRIYEIRDRADKPQMAYRFTVVENVVEGAYYGVQGTTWRTPPLLAHPSAVRRVNGRRLELFRSGKRLRYVAWRTSTGSYWISNTLTMKLRDDQMLALAASLTSAKAAR